MLVEKVNELNDECADYELQIQNCSIEYSILKTSSESRESNLLSDIHFLKKEKNEIQQKYDELFEE
jgi:hypothetical protein